MRGLRYCGLLLSILMILPQYASGAIPAEERAALIIFYNATNGDTWGASTWKNPPLEADGFSLVGTEDTWNGVLQITSDHVTRFDLRERFISGTIPADIENLSKLQYLILYDNNLTGTLPPELGNLVELVEVKKSEN